MLESVSFKKNQMVEKCRNLEPSYVSNINSESTLRIWGDIVSNNIVENSTLVKSFNINTLDSKILELRNLISGRYVASLSSNKDNYVAFWTDTRGRADLFYLHQSDQVYLSEQLGDLVNLAGFVDVDQFAITHVLLTETGPRPPKKHTFHKNIKKIGPEEFLLINNNSVLIKKLDINLPATETFLAQEHNTYAKIFLEILEEYGSKDENFLYLSSGWDSTSILAGLVHIFGPKRVKAITASVTLSQKMVVFNPFEISRAREFAEYYGVKLEVIDINYQKNGNEIYNDSELVANKYGYHGFTLHTHIQLAKNVSKMRECDSTVVFAGEVSDGAHNLGFAQYTSSDHADLGYREYSDKIQSYLFGPTFRDFCYATKNPVKDELFARSIAKNQDLVFNFNFSDLSELDNLILRSFFSSPQRIPFISLKNVKFLTTLGHQEHESTLRNSYFDGYLGLDRELWYSVILSLYASFHWNGSSVNSLYTTADEFGLRLRLPFFDDRILNFLSKMPENWGRGLDINPVKFPLKKFLADHIKYPLNLQRGPHSYLTDVDSSSYNPRKEMIYGVMRNYYLEILDKIDLEIFDQNYFDRDCLNKILKEFKQGQIGSTIDPTGLLHLFSMGHSKKLFI